MLQNKLHVSAARSNVQSNPVDTDTEEAIESVCISGVSVLSGSCYLSPKYSFYLIKILQK